MCFGGGLDPVRCAADIAFLNPAYAAQDPNPFDGLFDISIAQNLSKIEIIKNLGLLFNGEIVLNKKVATLKAATIDIQLIENDALIAQADGEIIGSGGFKATIIPKAFSFYC